MASPALLEDLAAVRGRLRDRIDPRLATIIVGSLLAHFGIAVWAWTADVDTGVTLAPSVAQRFYQETIDVRLPEEPPTVGQPGVAAPVAPHQVPAPIVKRVAAVTPRIVEPMDPLRMASLLTGPETAPGGMSDMNRRRPGGDLEKQIAELDHSPITIGRRFTDLTPRLGTDRGPVVEVPPGDPIPAKQGRDPGRIAFAPSKHESGTTLSPDTIVDKIQHSYIVGLRRCYEHGLATEPDLRGKVSLGFTIDASGRTIDGSASGLNTEVDACIQKQVATWRFPVPHDARTHEPTEQPFALGLILFPR